MDGAERDRFEHEAALLRFGGKMPKGALPHRPSHWLPCSMKRPNQHGSPRSEDFGHGLILRRQ